MVTTHINGQGEAALADRIALPAASLLGSRDDGNGHLEDPATFAQGLHELATIAQRLGTSRNATTTVLTSLPLYETVVAQVAQHLTASDTLMAHLCAIARDVEQAQERLVTARRQAMAGVAAIEAVDLTSAGFDSGRLRELVKLADQATLMFERLSEAATQQAELLERAQKT